MAAPAFSWQAGVGGTGTTSWSVTLPATATNDIIIVAYPNRDAADEATYGGTYSGGSWTTFLSGTSSNPGVFVRWSRATGDHTGQTVTGSGMTGSTCCIVTGYTGCITTGSPIDTNTNQRWDNASPDVNTLDAFNTTVADTLVCLVTGGTDDVAAISSVTKDGGGTAMNLDNNRGSSGGSDSCIAIASIAQSSSGSTGQFDFVQNLGVGDAKWIFGFALKPPTGAVTGSATMSGAGALTAAGKQSAEGAATMSGTGALTAAGKQSAEGAATMSGAGDLTATGAIVKFGVATMSGAGDLSASGKQSAEGIATMSGAGALTATGAPHTVTGQAALSGAGDLSAAGKQAAHGAATASGSGALTAAGTPTVKGAAALSGAGDLSATGKQTAYGAAALAGTGDLTADGTVSGPSGEVFGEALLSGTGALTADGDVTVWARPDGTVTTNGWTAQGAATLWEAIDETLVADSDYIQSAASPVSADICEVSLGNLNDPLSSVGHLVRYRYRKDSTGGDTINLTVRLVQGTTVIASWTETNIDAITTVTRELSTAEADAITDYTDLRLRFEAVAA